MGLTPTPSNNTNATVQALRNSSQTLTEVFTYTMRDSSGLESTSQISITIEGQNDEQVIATNTGTTLAEGSTGNVITSAMLQTTDVDDAVGVLTYTLNSVPTNGALRLNGAALTLGQTFTHLRSMPVSSLTIITIRKPTSDSFNFTVDDGSGVVSTGTFNFTVTGVNDTPVVVAPAGSLNTTEDTWIAIEGAGFSFTDADAGAGTLQMTLNVTQGYITVGLGNSGYGL